MNLLGIKRILFVFAFFFYFLFLFCSFSSSHLRASSPIYRPKAINYRGWRLRHASSETWIQLSSLFKVYHRAEKTGGNVLLLSIINLLSLSSISLTHNIYEQFFKQKKKNKEIQTFQHQLFHKIFTRFVIKWYWHSSIQTEITDHHAKHSAAVDGCGFMFSTSSHGKTND